MDATLDLASGMRPINAIVDATTTSARDGQPIHAFDAASGDEGIVVRRGQESGRRSRSSMVPRACSTRDARDRRRGGGLVIAVDDGRRDARLGEDHNDSLDRSRQLRRRNILQTSQRLGPSYRAPRPLRTRPRPEHGVVRDGPVSPCSREHPAGRPPMTPYHSPRARRTLARTLRLGGRAAARHACADGEASSVSKHIGCGSSGKTIGVGLQFRPSGGISPPRADPQEVGRLIGLDRVPETLPPFRDWGDLRKRAKDPPARTSTR